jgi:lysophospholipase L1-like esterase
VKALSLLALLCLAACGGGGGGAGGASFAPVAAAPMPPTKQAPAAPDCSVALYGDSIMAGYVMDGSRLAEPPAAALKRLRPAYRIVDHSAAGETANARMATFVNDTPGTRLVVLEDGMNDATLQLAYEQPLRTMVQRAKALAATPIVTGLSHTRAGAVPLRDAYDQVARSVAADEGAVFADWGAVRFDAADMADDVHPAQAYSTRLVEQLAAALDRAAPECAP